jgi:integrase
MQDKTKYFTTELYIELDKNIADLNPRKMTKDQIRTMFRTLLSGAFRISEVLSLTPIDIMPDGMLRLRFTKTGWEKCKCSKWGYHPKRLLSSDLSCNKCKGQGRYRIDQFGWVTPEILVELKELAQKTPPDKRLFPITRRQALNYTHEIANSGTHAFRHTWLTWLAGREELNLAELKTKSRHTNLQTLSNYVHANKDLVRIKENKLMFVPGTEPKTDVF